MTDDTFILEPLGTNLVIKRSVNDTVSEHGILMPESVTSEKLSEGTVMAVGRGSRDSYGERIPLDVEIGDYVMWGAFTGSDVIRGDDEFCILNESDILAILRE